MTIQELLSLQTQRGAKIVGTSSTVVKTIDTVTEECRKEIERQSDKYRDLDPLAKKEAIKDIIIAFIMDTKPLVSGFTDSDNRPDTNKLINKLVEDITDYGILTQAMIDESIFEIRANGKEIKVEKNGRVQDLTDSNGNIISFESPEQQEIIMKKMLGDVRLTPKDALISSSTLEGFRVAAVHSSAMGSDPDDITGAKYHSFVLRKFKKSKMTLSNIVNTMTLSDNMARTLALCPAGGLTFVTVGPTASGKTTTNNAILQAVPATTRTILIQNPSEISLRFRDSTGRVVNDVLHLEAREIENPTASDPTPSNLMIQSLRLSPSFICFGEIRSSEEFKQGMTIMEAGHPMNTTYHAESAEGAIQRYLTAYLSAAGNEPSYLALATLTSLLNIIIVQKIMRDGKRRIIQITEVLGVDPKDKEKPLLNDLYRFEITDEPEYNDDGTVKRIIGEHKRVGKISDKMIRKFDLEGVARSRYDFLTKDVSESEVETYTGENIESYGMNINRH